MNLERLQRDVAAWHWNVFGSDCPPWAVALKVAEEAGEVCRAVVESDYPSVNGTGRTSDLADELGDVIIAAAALAGRSGINLTDAVADRWAVVGARR